MLRQLGIVVVAVTFWAAALAPPATAREGTATATSSPATAASADLSAQKVKRARKPAARRIAAAGPIGAPYYQQCFMFFCNGGRPFHWLVLGVAY
jgi:hypothetical protein